MGEYQAILRLRDKTRRGLTPLIQIPEIGYDFKEKRLKKTLDEHLEGFVLKKIHKKWGDSFCFVDLKLIGFSERLENGIHPVKYVFNDLRTVGCSAVPVTGLNRDSAYQQEVKDVLVKDMHGVCLRLSIEEAAKSTFAGEIDSLLSTLDINAHNCDLIIELGAPNNYEPLKDFTRAIQAIVSRIPYLEKWRTFSVLGTSLPDTMGSIRLGVNNIPRSEWELYKELVRNLKKPNLRLPTFSDYAISHPTFSEYDMRLAKPSVKIRYTTDNSYYIVKGHNIRDDRFGKNKQYHDLSRKIIESQYYCGSEFSWGDKYIRQCAYGSHEFSIVVGVAG